MKIPKSVRVGGKTYQVEITDRLTLGRVCYSGETDFIELLKKAGLNGGGRNEAV